MARALKDRPMDAFYRLFFIVMAPIQLFVDLAPFYPSHKIFDWNRAIHSYGYTTMKDPLFNPNVHRAWFDFLAILEAGFQIPLMLYLIVLLTKDAKQTPIYLLIWACHSIFTTLPCIAEQYADKTDPLADKLPIMSSYMIYVILPIVIMFDTYGRLIQSINAADSMRAAKKQ